MNTEPSTIDPSPTLTEPLQQSNKRDNYNIALALLACAFVLLSGWSTTKLVRVSSDLNKFKAEKAAIDEMQSEILRFYVNDGLISGNFVLLTNSTTRNIHLVKVVPSETNNTNTPIKVDGKPINPK